MNKKNFCSKKLIILAFVVSASVVCSPVVYKSLSSQLINLDKIDFGNTNKFAKENNSYEVNEKSSKLNKTQFAQGEITYESEQGAIFYAWNWSFETIEKNLKYIADAGYTSIQVSPIQGNIDMESNLLSNWDVLYKPINFKIGNQLGDRDAFVSLCKSAKENNLEVYVEVVANNTGNKDNIFNIPHEKVDVEIMKLGNKAWHLPLVAVGDTNDRYETINGCVGLPDLNTGNEDLQKIIRAFLEDVLKAGADGFCVNKAKHIELPTDIEGVKSDFWLNVFSELKKEDGTMPYVYGDLVQGGADEFSAYSDFINVTASNYGAHVREGVGFENDIDPSKFIDFDVENVSQSKLITYVESLENYINDSTEMSDEEIINAWAVICARAEANPLFFNRPSRRNFLDGNIGEAGNDLWRDADIVSVNKFRVEMIGEDERLTQIDEDIIMIERGTSENSEKRGVVLVNLGDSRELSDININLENGEYNNCASPGGIFYVEDGIMTGTIESGITVLYKDGVQEEVVQVPTVYLDKESQSFEGDSLELYLSAENTNNATYSIDGSDKVQYNDGDVLYIGNDKEEGAKICITLEGVSDDGSRKVKEEYFFIKRATNSNSVVYFQKPEEWCDPYVYVVNEVGERLFDDFPGKKMVEINEGLYKCEISDWTNCKIIINDWFYGNNQTEELELKYNEIKIYDEAGQWKDSEELEEVYEIKEESEEGRTVVYFRKPNDEKWGKNNVNIYFYGTDGPEWPGIPMKQVENEEGLYKYTLPIGCEDSHIIFNLSGKHGEVQIPKVGESAFQCGENKTMIYEDGKWMDYDTYATNRSGWIKDSNAKWYYINSDGSKKKGWLKDTDGNWYYLYSDGSMATGWLEDTDGNWYYFYSNGSMAINTTIDSYELGSDGKMIK